MRSIIQFQEFVFNIFYLSKLICKIYTTYPMNIYKTSIEMVRNKKVVIFFDVAYFRWEQDMNENKIE